MNFELAIKKSSSIHKKIITAITDTVKRARSLEELIFEIAEVHPNFRIGLMRMKDTGSDALGMFVSNRTSSDPFAIITLPWATVDQSYTIHPLPEGLVSFADQKGFTIDEDEFIRRNRSFNMYNDPVSDETIIPPDSFIDLILSYANHESGLIEIEQQSLELHNGFQRLLQITLNFYRDGTDEGWTERAFIACNKLRAYLYTESKGASSRAHQ